jgi:hypothetical protein
MDRVLEQGGTAIAKRPDPRSGGVRRQVHELDPEGNCTGSYIRNDAATGADTALLEVIYPLFVTVSLPAGLETVRITVYTPAVM